MGGRGEEGKGKGKGKWYGKETLETFVIIAL